MLDHYKCPRCGQRGKLYVVGLAWFELDEDGAVFTGEPDGDIEWDDKSGARCPECGHDGRLGDFCCEEEEKEGE
jgi:DNA-directed RNA polymerase subunit RPC12/RpoP